MAPNAGSRIALIDDEDHIRETVTFALAKEGYAVVSYPDGVAAWEAMQEQLPDLAIVDIMMPRMDGFELCRRLRGRSDCSAPRSRRRCTGATARQRASQVDSAR